MRIATYVAAVAMTGGLAAGSGTALAAAGDECVKVLGYEWSGEKQSMDPADMHSGDDAYHTFAVYNRLVDVDDNFNVIPELATEWSVSDDGLTWTFKLREGVKFHSGKDFTSADVVYSFKRLLDPALGSGVQLRLALPVEEDAAIAQRLNANEAAQPDAHQLGAWCLDPDRGLTFVSFIPSAACMPNLVRALVYHAAGRNEWARELLFPQ